jgi:hypothetical protein
VTFQTASGPLQGPRLRQVPVQAGHLGLSGTTVAVGLVGGWTQTGCLGKASSRALFRSCRGEMRLTPLSCQAPPTW